jgi:hypothetical protein
MPTYNLRNRETGEEFVSEIMSMSEIEEYLKANPHIDRLCSAPFIGDPWRQGMKKPDNEFRDRLKHIKKTHGGNFNTF